MKNNKGKLPLIFFGVVIILGVVGAIIGAVRNNGTITIVSACVAFLLLAGFMIVTNIRSRLAEKKGVDPNAPADQRFLRHSVGEDDGFGMDSTPIYQPSGGRRGWDESFDAADMSYGEEPFAGGDYGFAPGFAVQELDDLGDGFQTDDGFGGSADSFAAPFTEEERSWAGSEAESKAAQEDESSSFRKLFSRRAAKNDTEQSAAEAIVVPAAATEDYADADPFGIQEAEQKLAAEPVAAEPAQDFAEEQKPRRLPFGARERRARAAKEEENARSEQEAARLAEEQARLEAERIAKESAEAAQLAEAKAAAQAVMQGEDYYGVYGEETTSTDQPAAPEDIDDPAFRPVLKLDGTEQANIAEENVAPAPEQAAAAVQAAATAAAATAATAQPVVQGQPLETFYEMDDEALLYRDCVEVWAADAKPCLLRLMRYIDSIEDKHTAAVFGRECEYVNAMIDRIIYFNHLEYIDSMLDVKEYDFKSMVMECLKRFSPFLIEKKIGLLWKGLDLTVRTDRRWFIFALTQIIFNSVEFTAEGGKIAITAKQSGEYVDLIIDDSGKGISAEEMPYVFVAGYMGDDSPNAAGRRTGMGLFIARSVLNKMGGDVFAESNPGKGTRVVMRMPTNVE